MQPLINILIRVSRLQLFERCINSIKLQTYSNYKIIVCIDSSISGNVYGIASADFMNKVYQFTAPITNKDIPFHWNLFCNNLKSHVTDGFFLYLDDDDFLLSPTILEQLSEYLTDDVGGLIVQFLRNGKPKPSTALIAAGRIEKGRIGGGCLVLHSRHKDVADWGAKQAADYDWIAAVAAKVQLKFVPLVVQVTSNNGLKGKPQ